jgi:hypothetical protein
MELIQKNIAHQNLDLNIGLKINHHLVGLSQDNKSDNQKILELCQIGKFIASYFNDFEIKEIREKPDFLISNGNSVIGLEHQLILDSISKAKEGYYENICRKAELALEEIKDLPNFLINIYIKLDVSTKIEDKSKIIESISNVVLKFIRTGILQENDFIEDVFQMPHSSKSIIPNFGAYMQKQITNELIVDFVAKKESKIDEYRKNSVQKQWLVLLIGGLGESSYAMNNSINVKLETKFDKVYMYEDFKNNLYQLK